MALTATHAAAQHWPRWSQEQSSGPEYTMMDTSAAMMPYQRPAMNAVYVASPLPAPPPQSTYQPVPVAELQPSPFAAHVGYNFTPLPAQMQQSHSDMGHQQYRTHPHIQELTPPRVMDPEHEHSSYASSPASTLVPTFRQAYPPHMAQHGAMPMQHSNSYVGQHREYKALTYGQQTPSPTPSVKCESIRGDDSNIDPTTGHKTITTNITEKGTLQAEFHTSIDELMKTIQSKEDSTKSEDVKQVPSVQSAVQNAPAPVAAAAVAKVVKPTSKKHICNVPECGRRFSQKTHLDMHLRSHSNVRPYACTWPGCGKTVSQLGNLRTHERRHTGEKPYKCDICDKRFAQRGNVRAHKNVHLNQKPYQCILDDCNKRFSQRGNLKSHQNHFHAETLKGLTAKFAQMQYATTVSEEDKEFLEYFAKLYKNSNKGIKGRGKACKISSTPSSASTRMAILPMSPPGSASMSPVSPMHTDIHHHHRQQQQHHHHQIPPQYENYGLVAQMPLPGGHASYNAGAAAAAGAAAVAPEYHAVGYPTGTTAYAMGGARPMLAIQTSGEGMHQHHHQAQHLAPHAGFVSAQQQQQQQQQHHHQSFSGSFDSSDGSVHSAATTIYEGEHGRELAFGERMY